MPCHIMICCASLDPLWLAPSCIGRHYSKYYFVQVLHILHDRFTYLTSYRTVLPSTAVASSPHLYCTVLYVFMPSLHRSVQDVGHGHCIALHYTTLECKMHNALTLYISSSSSSLSSSSSSVIFLSFSCSSSTFLPQLLRPLDPLFLLRFILRILSFHLALHAPTG